MRTYRPHSDRPTSLALLALAPLLCIHAAATSASDFSVTVRTTTDHAIQGKLLEFSLSDGLVIQTDPTTGPRTFEAADVVEIVAHNPAAQPLADSARLELAGGDLLFGTVTGFADENTEFQTQTFGSMHIPLDRIRLLTTVAGQNPEHRRAVSKLLAQKAGDDDALLLVNGDVVRGLITAIDDQAFTIDTAIGESRIAAGSVAAAVVAPLEHLSSRSAQVRIHTTDGQRLTASQFHWSGFSALAVVFDHAKLKIAGDRIERLDLIGGRWEWITALAPISYEHTPAISLPWTWQPNRNVVGSPIRVAGRQFEHGLGVHGPSSITFDLKGDYAEFVTYLGLDDDTGPFANVDVEIRVDGQLRFEQQDIGPGVLHGPIRLSVNGAQRIKLSVLLGENADIQDRFNWVQTALIRPQPNP